MKNLLQKLFGQEKYVDFVIAASSSQSLQSRSSSNRENKNTANFIMFVEDFYGLPLPASSLKPHSANRNEMKIKLLFFLRLKLGQFDFFCEVWLFHPKFFFKKTISLFFLFLLCALAVRELTKFVALIVCLHKCEMTLFYVHLVLFCRAFFSVFGESDIFNDF